MIYISRPDTGKILSYGKMFLKKNGMIGFGKELHKTKYDLEDPLDEDEDSPVPGLTHRYPDRVLFLVTNQCSMYCRYCTRRRFSGQIGMGVPKKQLDAAINYIRQTPQVRDVLISGGGG